MAIAFAQTPRLDAVERKFAEEHGMSESPPAQIRAAMVRAAGLIGTKYATPPALARALAPRPIVELAGRMFLRDSERRRLFDGHDSGDEDPRARNYARFVCGSRQAKDGRRCDLEPVHLGPHDWEREIDPNALLELKPFNQFAIVTAEQLAEAERAELKFQPHDGEG